MMETRQMKVLRYLGCQGQKIDPETTRLITECLEETDHLKQIKSVYRCFEILPTPDGLALVNSGLKLRGNSIKRHLEHSKRCILMAVTVGHRIDTQIRLYGKTDLGKALILDACASVSVEEACDRLSASINSDLAMMDEKLTSRFSPGYGDLPLAQQKGLLRVLNAEKRIGLTASEESILIPRKSVTAIAGIIKADQDSLQWDCLECSQYDTCKYREEGVYCGR